jgi:hypothetical protein
VSSTAVGQKAIRSTIPARLDRLRWSRFHTHMVVGLGATWILDGCSSTVSETWPIEIRAEAIAVFFAIAQIFGAIGPAIYGWLIGDGANTTGLSIGYLVGGGIMILGGIVALVFGIKAEGKSLEDITKPLTAADGTAAPAPATG